MAITINGSSMTPENCAPMQDEAIDTSYEPFSREPEYIEANRAFIRTLTLTPGMRILDLACGTGTMTDLLLEKISGGAHVPSPVRKGPSPRVIGIDLSRESLLLAQTHLGDLGYLRASKRSQPSAAQNGADTVGLIVPGGNIAVKLAKVALDYSSTNKK